MGLSAGHRRGLPRHRHLSRRARAAGRSRRCARDALVGAIQYYDAQVDDARHTMTLVRTAAAYGALVANRARGRRVPARGRAGHRRAGARLRVGDAEIEVRARQVVNATGVWTDDTQAMVGERGQFHVRASKGVHLVVPRDRIQSSTGLILRTETSVLFVIPWGRHWIIGTTDTDWDLDKAHPAASAADIDYLLEHVNRVLVTPLTREDVEGVYAGLRPLLSGESESTSKLSREHAVGAAGAGPGGRGGRQVHDVPGDGQGRRRRRRRTAWTARCRACCTDRVPLLGAEGYAALWNAAPAAGHPARPARRAGRAPAAAATARWSHEVLALVDADPDAGRAARPAPTTTCAAEVVYAASHEGARHLDDVLTRRTRISIETCDRGVAAAPARPT